MHSVTTGTSFVAGDREIATGCCGTFGDWEPETRQEAQRIATGLDGSVIEEIPAGLREVQWTDNHGQPQASRFTELLCLAVAVDGRVVARVRASRQEPCNWTNDPDWHCANCGYRASEVEFISTKHGDNDHHACPQCGSDLVNE